MPRLPPTSTPPQGLLYLPELVTEAEEAALLDHLAALPLQDIHMHGVVARRRVAHFGYDYGYTARAVEPGLALPEWTLEVRDRLAALTGHEPGRLAELLVTRYPPGAGIGWHRDAPMFGTVFGLSLKSACRLRMRRTVGEVAEGWETVLAPRSAYVLQGQARWQWQHTLPPVKDERWSLTFRTLREG